MSQFQFEGVIKATVKASGIEFEIEPTNVALDM